MSKLIQKSITAKRESKHIEFKESFDPTSPQEWCEIIKDIVAIANSGGGVILFGVDNVGKPCRVTLKPLSDLDPAEIADKISKYTGSIDLEFDICEVTKGRRTLIAFLIQAVSIPIVFKKPGTYDIGSGKQRTAFSVGTVYFRHGAKSEPGTSDDIRRVIERQLDNIRKSWIKGVRKVVRAPEGSQVITLPSNRIDVSSTQTTTVRAVKDPKATPVLLTRDRKKASGVFVHEEVSEGIFDEINNVIDANKALAKGQKAFFFGLPVYYRVYAERHHVKPDHSNMLSLLHSAVSTFYAPGLYWTVHLPEKLLAETFTHLYLHPKSPHIYSLIRIAILIGKDFSEWLYNKWHQKWKRLSQPPSFYWTFKEMMSHLKDTDERVIAARTTPSAKFGIGDNAHANVKDCLENPEYAAAQLSKVCMKIFNGESQLRSVARNLDYFAYGLEIKKLSPKISKAIIKEIGEQKAGDFA